MDAIKGCMPTSTAVPIFRPLGAEQGDNQDECAFLFGMLRDDAVHRNLDEDEFYHLTDHILTFFVRCQGYEELHEMVMRGEMSRIKFAHDIRRPMPEAWYTNFVSEVVRLSLQGLAGEAMIC